MRDRAGYLLAGLCLAALWAGYAQGDPPDSYANVSSTVASPAVNGIDDVTPTDTQATWDAVPGMKISRALWVGGAGDVHVKMAGGNDVTFENVPEGTLLPARVVLVYSTGTTATPIDVVW